MQGQSCVRISGHAFYGSAETVAETNPGGYPWLLGDPTERRRWRLAGGSSFRRVLCDDEADGAQWGADPLMCAFLSWREGRPRHYLPRMIRGRFLRGQSRIRGIFAKFANAVLDRPRPRRTGWCRAFDSSGDSAWGDPQNNAHLPRVTSIEERNRARKNMNIKGLKGSALGPVLSLSLKTTGRTQTKEIGKSSRTITFNDTEGTAASALWRLARLYYAKEAVKLRGQAM